MVGIDMRQILNKEDWKILAALIGEGGLSIRVIRSRCDAFSCRNEQMRAANIRQCLLHMQKEGLVEPMDDQKSVVWQLTEKGKEALQTRDRDTDE